MSTEKTVEEIVEELMKEYRCIDPSCDQQGCTPHQVSETEWEPQQCEYCYVVRFPYKEKLTQTLQAERTKRDEMMEAEREKTIEDVKHLLKEELAKVEVTHSDGSISRVFLESQMKYLDTLTQPNTCPSVCDGDRIYTKCPLHTQPNNLN